VYTACVSQFSELVTSDIGAHRDDEQEIVTGRQFHETIFSTTLTALLIQIYSGIMELHIFEPKLGIILLLLNFQLFPV
jgi:hypothetical protein